MILYTVIIGVIGYFVLKFYRKCSQLPPGPLGIPVLGNLLHLMCTGIRKRTILDLFWQVEKEYGPVFTFHLGGVSTVSIADYDIAMDAMVKNGNNYSNRNMPDFTELLTKGRGIIFSSGEFWQQQRRFSLHTLRNLGLGRNTMEAHIMNEVEHAMDELNKQIDKSQNKELNVDGYEMFDRMVANIINRMLFSDRFSKEKEDYFLEQKRKIDKILENITPWEITVLTIHVHIFRFPYGEKVLNRIHAPQFEILDFLKKQIDERKQEIEDGRHVIEGDGQDYVDAYLLQIQKEREAGNEATTTFDVLSLKQNLFDLWLAGQETTSTTLAWAFVYFLQNPRVIEKLKTEIHKVTNNDRRISLDDRSSTPYLNATILEVLRHSKIVPLNIWRDTSEDAVVGGQPVPKGTAIAAQVSMIMNDEKHFKESDKFHPERFIEDPSLTQRVLAFGIGKRACLGEALARAELYLIIANFVQRYSFATDPEHLPETRAVSEMGSIRKPKKYKINVRRDAAALVDDDNGICSFHDFD